MIKNFTGKQAGIGQFFRRNSNEKLFMGSSVSINVKKNGTNVYLFPYVFVNDGTTHYIKILFRNIKIQIK